DYSGNLQDIDKISDYVHRVAKAAGVQFNLYMLRHQLSTDLFTAGVPANIIRDIMGHESASMSLGYAVSNATDRQAAINQRIFS
ncbi:MAG: tyrosine-type recombinase/integrase, partial [Solobacterium sp.]|nr:tyrosine-type recombinase/integrase [Solobacterium sp.]